MDRGLIVAPLAEYDRARTFCGQAEREYKVNDESWGRLPSLPSAIFGRQEEVDNVVSLLELPHVRLVSITGSVGIGKTTFATLVAHRWRERTGGDVRYTDLFGSTDAQQSLSTLRTGAATASVPTDEADPRLLVIDGIVRLRNLEREFGAIVAQHWPTKFLVVGPLALGIADEHRVVLGPLELPENPDELVGDVEATASEVMFAALARRVSPGGDVDERRALVAMICRRLDGVPLALEIAAFQLRSLSLSALLRKLEDGWSPRMRGPASLPPQQRSLAQALEGNMAILDDVTRRAFIALGTFAGKITVEAAAEVLVYACPECRLKTADDVLDVLTRLVDHSLLATDRSDSSVVFRMPHTVRDVANKMLDELDCADQIRGAHAHYFFTKTMSCAQSVGREAEMWFSSIDESLDDVRETIGFLLNSSDQRAQQLAAALRQFWLARGLLLEGLDWLDRTLELDPGVETPSRTRAMEARAVLTGASRSYANALSEFEECCNIWRRLGDQGALGRALVDYASAIVEVEGFPSAEPVFSEAIALLDQEHDRWSAARARSLFGASAAARPDRRRFATEILQEAIEEFRALGDFSNTNLPLQQMGRMLHVEGHDDQAKALLNEGLAIVAGNGDAWNMSIFLNLLAEIELDDEKPVAAARLYAESLALAVKIGALPRMIWCLEGLAASFAALGEQRYGARVVGMASALRAELNLADWVEFPARMIDLMGVYSTMSQTEFEFARDSGSRTAVSDLLDAVPALLNEAAVRISQERQHAAKASLPDGLTRREVEVLRLIAAGKTSRAIASELFISIETVGRHITNLYRKIDALGRADATAYAIRMKLTK